MTKEFTVSFPQDQFNTLANLLQLIVVAGLRFHGEGNAIPTVEDLKPIWRTLISARIGDTQNGEDTELEFLRFFFQKVYPCLGPADSDIIDSIKRQFIEDTKKKIPATYDDEGIYEAIHRDLHA